MPDIDPVILQLRAEVKQYQNEVRATTTLVTNQLDRQERSIASLEHHVERSSGRIAESFKRMGTSAAALLSGFSAGVIIKELADLADTSKQIDAQLKLATATFGTFGQAQEGVRRISAETRAALGDTAGLYAAFNRAALDLGGTQAQAAQATETFAKALKIGGASSEDAANATRQFQQALAGGILRAEEFNSVVEASPRVARLFADGLNTSIGGLRQLVNDGKVSADQLFAILNSRKLTAGIDAEFRQIPVTFGDAMQAMENAAITSFGEFDKGGRFSDAIVTFLGTGTDTFEGLTSKAEEFGRETRAVMDGLGNVFDPIGANGNAVFDALGIRIYSVREQVASLLDSLDRFANFDTNIENAVKRGLNRAIDRAGGGQKFELTPLQRLGGDFRQGARRSDARGRIDAAARRLEANGFVVPRNADGTVNEAGIVRRQAAPRRAGGGLPGQQSANAKALEKHQETLAGLEKLKVTASAADLATINRKIAREKKIVANLEQGVSLSAATAAAGGSGRGGKTEAQREAEKAAKAYKDLIADIESDLRDGIASLSSVPVLESERIARARRNAQSVLGREGEDYQDPFAGVADYDRERDARFEAAEDAERRAQDIRADNVRDLADLYGDLFTRNTDDVWRNFKDQGLRTIALVLAQATVASFSKGGGGFGSLLSNIASAAGSAAGSFGRASGGYVGPGQTVRVNEGGGRGPELLRMGAQGGTVIPLGQTRAAQRGGSTTIVQHISVDGRNSVTPANFAGQILDEADRRAGQAIAGNNGIIRKSLPAAQDRYGKLGTTG